MANEILDLAIIGSGPAALSAAIYAGRAGLNVTVFEKQQFGGTLNQIAKIENYPGFIGGGSALAGNMKDQAVATGAKIEYGTCEEIGYAVSPTAEWPQHPKVDIPFKGHISDEILYGDYPLYLIIDGERIEARAVIVATGSEPRPLEVKTKTPVSYCAICDGTLYKDKKIAVVGGGNSALQESMYLAGIAKSVTIFSHHDVKAEPYLIKKVENQKNIELKQKTEPTTEVLDSFDAVFAFIGKRPATSFLGKGFEGDEPGDEYECKLLNEDGYIIAKDGYTSIPGVFAAGDVCADSVKQVVTATASGATAALKAIEYLKRFNLKK